MRCLDPESHSDPTKWSTYNMHTYRTASSKEALAMVDRFKFDPNFNNWMDPRSLKAFADNPNKAWLDSYGFDNVKKVKWSGSDIMTADTSKCHFKCATLVSSQQLDHQQRRPLYHRKTRDLRGAAGSPVASSSAASLCGCSTVSS